MSAIECCLAADVVIKAQVLAGGRGLGTFTNGFHGGVHIVTRAKQAHDIAASMLGQRLITKQTGSEGRRVDKASVRSVASIDAAVRLPKPEKLAQYACMLGRWPQYDSVKYETLPRAVVMSQNIISFSVLCSLIERRVPPSLEMFNLLTSDVSFGRAGVPG